MHSNKKKNSCKMKVREHKRWDPEAEHRSGWEGSGGGDWTLSSSTMCFYVSSNSVAGHSPHFLYTHLYTAESYQSVSSLVLQFYPFVNQFPFFLYGNISWFMGAMKVKYGLGEESCSFLFLWHRSKPLQVQTGRLSLFSFRISLMKTHSLPVRVKAYTYSYLWQQTHKSFFLLYSIDFIIKELHPHNNVWKSSYTAAVLPQCLMAL